VGGWVELTRVCMRVVALKEMVAAGRIHTTQQLLGLAVVTTFTTAHMYDTARHSTARHVAARTFIAPIDASMTFRDISMASVTVRGATSLVPCDSVVTAA
jgi:hypothetical protein